MTVRAAGGRRTGCATPSRSEQQQQKQQYSSSQSSIGAVVGCDRVFCGVVQPSSVINKCGQDLLADDMIDERSSPWGSRYYCGS